MIKTLIHVFNGAAIIILGQCTGRAQQGPKSIQERLSQYPGVVIDVRTPEEYRRGHYKTALNMDWNGGVLQAAADQLDKSKTYYLYCAAGGRSEQAAKYLKQKGFKNVINLGGYANMPKD